MRVVFGLQEKIAELKRVEVPAEFQTQLAKLYQVYLRLQAALAADDFDHAHQNLIALQTTAAAIDDVSISDKRARRTWGKEKIKLAQLLEHAHHLSELEAVREMFSSLSSVMGTLISQFGLGEVGPIYQFRCSMALDGEGATWFQNHEETKNPYFGAAMFGCADEV